MGGTWEGQTSLIPDFSLCCEADWANAIPKYGFLHYILAELPLLQSFNERVGFCLSLLVDYSGVQSSIALILRGKRKIQGTHHRIIL